MKLFMMDFAKQAKLEISSYVFYALIILPVLTQSYHILNFHSSLTWISGKRI